MSTQSKSMPKMDLKMYVRVVAAVFAISSVTATVLALVRLVSPDLYYLNHLTDKDRYTHYFICSLMIAVGIIGFINSFVVMTRNAVHNVGKNITKWLLLGSLFETSRIVYVFISEVVMKSDGRMRLWELGVSVAQYLVDSFLYCQMILRH